MKKILTGLQPTGVITIGNYIGSIKQMVENQDKYESYIFIADLHSITISQDPKKLQENIKSLLALYVACGIDLNKNTIFIQSENEYHANISWLLECNTYYGELSRMTQFKDKSLKHTNFSAGLLTYPVLMASDILAYDIDIVPVGIDQKQHVEITRDIAIRFNKKFGETFKIPDVMIKDGSKIGDLQEPTKKMSKSAENKKGIITLLDDITSVRKKIMSATTDSEMIIKYDPENKPGISNLITIYSSLTNKSIKEIEEHFKDSNYGNFKKEVADITCNFIKDIQDKYYKVLDSKEINDALDKGIEKTRKEAKEKYLLMKTKMGLGR